MQLNCISYKEEPHFTARISVVEEKKLGKIILRHS